MYSNSRWNNCYDGWESMLVVIDGYNLIFAVSDLERYVKVDNIEDAREKLISLLVRYRTKKKYNFILVFDSSEDCSYVPSKIELPGIEIVYANFSKDADTEIKNIIAHTQNPKDTIVVTNDNDIIKYVQKKGSTVLGSVSFYKQVVSELVEYRKTGLTEVDKSKVEGAPGADTEYWLEKFKEDKKDIIVEPDFDVKFEKDMDESSDELNNPDEPLSKFSGPSIDETEYWVQFFNKDQKDEE